MVDDDRMASGTRPIIQCLGDPRFRCALQAAGYDLSHWSSRSLKRHWSAPKADLLRTENNPVGTGHTERSDDLPPAVAFDSSNRIFGRNRR